MYVYMYMCVCNKYLPHTKSMVFTFLLHQFDHVDFDNFFCSKENVNFEIGRPLHLFIITQKPCVFFKKVYRPYHMPIIK